MKASAEPASLALRHSWLENLYALAVGCGLVVLGLALLQAAGLVTGGVAGIALLLRRSVPLPAGLLLAIANLPFLLLAARTMGAAFTARTVLVNIGLATLSALMPLSLRIDMIHPAFAALIGGSAIGMGVLAAARHGAGVGGSGVLSLWLFEARGWNAGRTQMAFDAGVLLVSAVFVPPALLAWSLLSAVATNGIMYVWHRPGRYAGY